MNKLGKSDGKPRRVRRSPAISYQELLDKDSRPVPDVLRIDKAAFLGDHDIPIDRYLDRQYHELEKEKIWKKVWQATVREERIPNVGDTEVYEINEISIFLVRTAPDTIKGFYNACLHMGRRLVDRPCKVAELRCPYHGFTWHTDGKLKHIPSMWDFPQIDPRKFNLPEVKVATWGGFVFINMDPDCEPLEAFLGDLNIHFEKYPLTERYTAVHVVKVIRSNWKTAHEPFLDAYHTAAAHPQLLAGVGDDNSPVDVFGNYSRTIAIGGIPSPHLKWTPTEDEIAAVYGAGPVPPGKTYRQYGAELARERLRNVIGDKADALCDSEVMDAYIFGVFPNFHPLGAYRQVVQVFKPYNDRHDMCTLEMWYLAPFKGERPPPAKTVFVGPDERLLDVPQLALGGLLIDQDLWNVEAAQRGMHTLRATKRGTTAGLYQFAHMRHFHNLYDRYIGLAPGGQK